MDGTIDELVANKPDAYSVESCKELSKVNLNQPSPRDIREI